MDDMNVEWLINHSFKGFCPIDVLLPQLISLNPIFGIELHEETNILKRKSTFLNVDDNEGKYSNSKS